MSRESRNPGARQWGGAVRGGNYIISFSGLPEHIDEVFCFLLGVQYGELEVTDAREWLDDHPNDFAQQFEEVDTVLELDRLTAM